MRRFFNKDNITQGFVNVGDSSLAGTYSCGYCGEACAQYGRFQIWVTENQKVVGKGCFCVPECALSFVKYRYTKGSDIEKSNMIEYIQVQAGRRVQEAPAPNLLAKFSKKGQGVKREYWLPICRFVFVFVEKQTNSKRVSYLSESRWTRRKRRLRAKNCLYKVQETPKLKRVNLYFFWGGE